MQQRQLMQLIQVYFHQHFLLTLRKYFLAPINIFSMSRYDSGFRDSGQLEQEPHLEKAINAVR